MKIKLLKDKIRQQKQIILDLEKIIKNKDSELVRLYQKTIYLTEKVNNISHKDRYELKYIEDGIYC